MPPILAVLPLKRFDRAKERLALPQETRAEFAVATASVVAEACAAAGFDLAVVTGDESVAGWATDRGATVIADPGEGLDAAASAGVAAAAAGRRWIVVHGDLPLLGAGDLVEAGAALQAGAAVLAPSRDGGTNLLGAPAPIAFHYGPASFARHLAAVGGFPHVIIVRLGTAVEIDTLADLATAATLEGGAWLRRFLA